MNIREAARRAGGEELVAKIDYAAEVESKALIGIEELMKAWQEDAAGDKEKRHLITLALCQALSQAFAKLSVEAYLTKMEDSAIKERQEVLVLAIHSLNNNITRAFEDADAVGVKDLLMGAVAKVGPLPKPQETEEK